MTSTSIHGWTRRLGKTRRRTRHHRSSNNPRAAPVMRRLRRPSSPVHPEGGTTATSPHSSSPRPGQLAVAHNQERLRRAWCGVCSNSWEHSSRASRSSKSSRSMRRIGVSSGSKPRLQGRMPGTLASKPTRSYRRGAPSGKRMMMLSQRTRKRFRNSGTRSSRTLRTSLSCRLPSTASRRRSPKSSTYSRRRIWQHFGRAANAPRTRTRSPHP